MRTRKKTRHIFSDKLETTFPESWEELTQEQLRYVYGLLAKDFSPSQVRTYAFVRFNGITVIEKREDYFVVQKDGKRYALPLATIAFGLMQYDWLENPPTSPVRLDTIGHRNATAIDAALHGLPFKLYIQLENLYQGFLVSQNPEAAQEMAKILYPEFSGEKLSSVELFNIVAWMAGVKSLFARTWPEFFSPAGSQSCEEPDMVAIMNAEIRALTGGDITKEDVVLNTDCWRALTELNEKTREARELQKSLKT